MSEGGKGTEAQKYDDAHCNSCGGERNHLVMAREVAEDDESEYEYHKEYFEILQCLGCDSVKARRVIVDSRLLEMQEGDDTRHEYLPAARSRRAPKWRRALPAPLQSLLSELYRAMHIGCNRLAAMGTRTLLDMAIVDKVGDVGTFEQKLKAFQDAGHISERQRVFLGVALDFGSAAAHRGHWPNLDDLHAALDMVESALQSVYALEKKAERLRQSTPPRSPPPGSSAKSP